MRRGEKALKFQYLSLSRQSRVDFRAGLVFRIFKPSEEERREFLQPYIVITAKPRWLSAGLGNPV